MFYKEKYKKYKSKYLMLKKNIQGGSSNKLVPLDLSKYDLDKIVIDNLDNIIIEYRQKKIIEMIKKHGNQLLDEQSYKIYFFEMLIDNVKYNCIAYIYINSYTLLFVDDTCDLKTILDFKKKGSLPDFEDISFIIIYFNSTDTITTQLNFNKINEMSKLETIFYIIEKIYRYMGYEYVTLTDTAEGICPGVIIPELKNCSKPNNNNIKYSLILYRIFMTKNDIQNISIYNKLGYTSDCINELNYLRTTPIQDIFNQIDSNKYSQYIYIKTFIENNKNNRQNFNEYFEKYSNIKNMESCELMAKDLNIIIYLMEKEKNNEYFKKLAKFINCVSSIRKKIDINFTL